MKLAEQQKIDNAKNSADLMKQADSATSNEEANRLNEQAVALRVSNSKLDGQIQQLAFRSHSLMQDVKKIGPNLKDIRLKLNKNWIPVWLKKPTDFRPTTKMPNFRLTDHQIQAISAYIWQSAFTDALPKQKPGNAAHGKDLLKLVAASLATPSARATIQGGIFAANLTRVGEKDNYDYLVRWVHNARERTRPYCPYEKKDIGPEDYAKNGLPYQFDLQHSQCPNDGHELQVQNMTVMPSLRLSVEDAQDVASFLVTQKKQEPSSYAEASFMDDPKLKDEGKKWSAITAAPAAMKSPASRTKAASAPTSPSKAASRSSAWISPSSPMSPSAAAKQPITDPEDLARSPRARRKTPGTTITDSSSTNLPSPTFSTRARSRREKKRCACPTST